MPPPASILSVTIDKTVSDLLVSLRALLAHEPSRARLIELIETVLANADKRAKHAIDRRAADLEPFCILGSAEPIRLELLHLGQID